MDSVEQAVMALPPLESFFPPRGAKKSLGQHFLHNTGLLSDIASLAAPLDRGSIIEIGPGTGGLTRALLIEGARDLYALECDPYCLKVLKSLTAVAQNRLHLLDIDARDCDMTKLGHPPRQIIANLPYNIASFLLRGWIKQAESFTQMILMFQKEVAERITSLPGSRIYGYLSVLVQYRFECEIVMQVPADAFTPPPKIDSAVIVLRPKTSLPCSYDSLNYIASMAFAQRRKTLRRAMVKLEKTTIQALCEQAQIDAGLRAEALSVDDYIRLAQIFDNISGAPPRLSANPARNK